LGEVYFFDVSLALQRFLLVDVAVDAIDASKETGGIMEGYIQRTFGAGESYVPTQKGIER